MFGQAGGFLLLLVTLSNVWQRYVDMSPHGISVCLILHFLVARPAALTGLRFVGELRVYLLFLTPEFASLFSPYTLVGYISFNICLFIQVSR